MIEPRHTPTVGRNLARHERQINRMGGWQLGDMVIEPGMGSQQFVDATGNVLFSVSPEDVQVRYKGGATSLTPLLEDTDRRIIEEHDYIGRMVASEAQSRQNGDASVTTTVTARAQSFANTAEANANGYTDGRVAAEATSRQNGDASVTATVTGRAQAYANDAEARAKSAAQGYANTAEANAKEAAAADATAKANTAESNAKAYSDKRLSDYDNGMLLGSKLPSRIDSLESRGTNWDSKLAALESRIRTLEGNT